VSKGGYREGAGRPRDSRQLAGKLAGSREMLLVSNTHGRRLTFTLTINEKETGHSFHFTVYDHGNAVFTNRNLMAAIRFYEEMT
jgi:hypothetical protein